MKKSVGVLSAVFLSLFFGTAFAAEPPLGEMTGDQPATAMTGNETVQEGAAISEPDIHPAWPFQPSNQYPGDPERGASLNVPGNSDLSVSGEDKDDKAYIQVGPGNTSFSAD